MPDNAAIKIGAEAFPLDMLPRRGEQQIGD